MIHDDISWYHVIHGHSNTYTCFRNHTGHREFLQPYKNNKPVFACLGLCQLAFPGHCCPWHLRLASARTYTDTCESAQKSLPFKPFQDKSVRLLQVASQLEMFAQDLAQLNEWTVKLCKIAISNRTSKLALFPKRRGNNRIGSRSLSHRANWCSLPNRTGIVGLGNLRNCQKTQARDAWYWHEQSLAAVSWQGAAPGKCCHMGRTPGDRQCKKWSPFLNCSEEDKSWPG